MSSKSSADEVANALGSQYNAHKIRLFPPRYLKEMFQKIKSKEEGSCYVAVTPSKMQHTVISSSPSSTPSPKKPRGIEISAEMRKSGLIDASYELTHIVLAYHGIFPLTSEHEVSHRCHNPACVRVEHLLWELHPANVDREQCRFSKQITCPKCQHAFSLCKHDPTCL